MMKLDNLQEMKEKVKAEIIESLEKDQIADVFAWLDTYQLLLSKIRNRKSTSMGRYHDE